MGSKQLTKSRFIHATQCPKLLWLKAHAKETLTTDEDRRNFMMEQGTAISELAHNLFPKGTKIDDNLSYYDKLTKTTARLKKNTPIFEGVFLFQNLFCMVDILQKTNDQWTIIKIKSATRIKELHIKDIAFQYYLLKQLNIPINDCYIYHINTSYDRNNTLDIKQLFTKANITEQVLNIQPRIKKDIDSYRQILLKKTAPNAPIGKHCLTPFPCHAYNQCWKEIPKKSIFNVHGLPMAKKLEHYTLGNINLNTLNSKEFTKKSQKIQIICEQEDLDYINIEQIIKFIESLNYPLSFLDFEAFQTAIPPFNHTHPYQQIPFQYSLHIQKKTKPFTHQHFIGNGQDDPRYTLTTQLIKDIPKTGHIVVFNRQYETDILQHLATLIPEYSQQLNNLCKRMIDLATPFQKGHIYLREMNGNYSLKSILPAMITTKESHTNTIDSGFYANMAYHNIIQDKKTKIHTDLLKKYCHQDTLSMVQIIEQLKQISS
jgi:hypothetical protein